MASEEDNPSLINSSYVVFFHATVILCAFLLAGTFNTGLYNFSLGINLLYGLGIFWFFYMLRQFQDENPILVLVFLFFSLSAILGFLSAVKGPLAEGEVPILGLFFFDHKIISWGVQTAYVYASVVVSYGYITYMISIAVASLLELFYTYFVDPFLPSSIKKVLKRADWRADDLSMRFSVNSFFMNQHRGVMATSVVLVSFAIIYGALLLFA